MRIELSDIDQNEFRRLWYALTNNTLSKRYNVHARTIVDWARKLGLGPKPTNQKDDPDFAFPANIGDPYDQAIAITSNRVIIIGDSEVPDHDCEMFEATVAMGKKFGIKELIINGDFIATDSFSRWARMQVTKIAFRQELDAAILSLKVFLRHFKSIWYVQGNHERRLPHTVDGELNIGDFLKQIGSVEFSEYDHCDLTSGGREIYVTHQKNFSKLPLSVPRLMWESRLKNIWCAHNHRLAWGYAPSGVHWLVEGGSHEIRDTHPLQADALNDAPRME